MLSHFNPRSREGSDRVDELYKAQNNNFNPRSREGSDDIIEGCQLVIGISIHAPAKGATFYTNLILLCRRISIHAPAKGATSLSSVSGRIPSDFNPRSREGSDLI